MARTGSVRVARWIAATGLLTALIVSMSAAPAQASCAAPVGTERQQQLQVLSSADVVFVGAVTSRGRAIRRDHKVYTPITFKVSVFLRGHAVRRVIVLAEGGTIGGSTYATSVQQQFTDPGLQLVTADRVSNGAQISGNACTGAGPTNASTVRKLIVLAKSPVSYDERFSIPAPKKTLTKPQLPDTGAPELLLLLYLAGGSMLVGACVWRWAPGRVR
jgi:hypothetical protein